MDPFHEAMRAAMMRARDAMNAALWREALSELEQAIVIAQEHGATFAEALWAVAVCRDALGEPAAAMEALDLSIRQDPTALTPHETRDALRERLRERATDRSIPLADRRKAVETLARHTARSKTKPRRTRAPSLSKDDRRVLALLLDR